MINISKEEVSLEVNSYSADSLIVYDNKLDEIIDGYNIDKVKAPASLTKVLTAIIALENINLDNYYLMSLKDVNIEGSSIYLHENDFVYGYDLVYGLLLRSGNDCATALANIYGYDDFVKLMNKKCSDLGLTNSKFINPTGLDGNFTTAYDLAVIYDYCLENKIFRKIIETKKHTIKLADRNLYLVNKHKLVMFEEQAISGKTGYLKSSGRTLVTYYEYKNKSCIIVTLNCGDDWSIHSNLARKYLSIKNE